MPASTFKVGRGARLDTITMNLLQADGTAANITGSTVKFQMWRDEYPGFKVNAAAVVVAANPAQVRYDWAAGDTDDDGTWNAQWEETTGAGLKRYYPSSWEDDPIYIRIRSTGGPP